MVKVHALRCPQCGGSINKASSFCEHCGAKVVVEDPNTKKIYKYKGRNYCPICGDCTDDKYVFRCSSCRRENICSQHKTDRNVCDQCDPEQQIRKENKKRREELEKMIKERPTDPITSGCSYVIGGFLLFCMYFLIVKGFGAWCILPPVIGLPFGVKDSLKGWEIRKYNKRIEEFKKKHNIEAE